MAYVLEPHPVTAAFCTGVQSAAHTTAWLEEEASQQGSCRSLC